MNQNNHTVSIKCLVTDKNPNLKLFRGLNLPHAVIKKLQQSKGLFIKFKEILSTTRKKEIALQFATNCIFNITVKKFLNNKNWKNLQALNAVYVENISAVKGEEEVVFPSGSEFIVEDVREDQLIDDILILTEIDITIPLYISQS